MYDIIEVKPDKLIDHDDQFDPDDLIEPIDPDGIIKHLELPETTESIETAEPSELPKPFPSSYPDKSPTMCSYENCRQTCFQEVDKTLSKVSVYTFCRVDRKIKPVKIFQSRPNPSGLCYYHSRFVKRQSIVPYGEKIPMGKKSP